MKSEFENGEREGYSPPATNLQQTLKLSLFDPSFGLLNVT